MLPTSTFSYLQTRFSPQPQYLFITRIQIVHFASTWRLLPPLQHLQFSSISELDFYPELGFHIGYSIPITRLSDRPSSMWLLKSLFRNRYHPLLPKKNTNQTGMRNQLLLSFVSALPYMKHHQLPKRQMNLPRHESIKHQQLPFPYTHHIPQPGCYIRQYQTQ
ncbi:hypothetical protein HanPSC8_Chr13g0552191 [Helianthus annuus]|nr:hypothetical protein HanPSC8_Chr13g0552191 [Helianthus annuus]